MVSQSAEMATPAAAAVDPNVERLVQLGAEFAEIIEVERAEQRAAITTQRSRRSMRRLGGPARDGVDDVPLAVGGSGDVETMLEAKVEAEAEVETRMEVEVEAEAEVEVEATAKVTTKVTTKAEVEAVSQTDEAVDAALVEARGKARVAANLRPSQ